MKKFIAISGSLRKESFNTHLAKAAIELAPEGVEIEVVDIGSLPLYNQDLEANFPEVAQAFKDKVKGADGIIIVTPEYNRSIPGALKNAIDWASRPYGQGAFVKKPVLIMGATPGNVGTAIAQSHLRVVMAFLDANVVAQPEFYLTAAHEKFDAAGKLTDEATREHVKKALLVLASY